MNTLRKMFAALSIALLSIGSPAIAADKPLVIEGAKIKQLPASTTLQVNASGTGAASINIPHGTAPTSPTNGDCWTTTTGLFCRINGSTVGPMGTGGGGGGTTTNALTINSSGGASPGATFNGSAAVTIDYSTVGAAKTGAITASGLTQATGKLLGRSTASTGAVEEITPGSGLTLTGGVLSSYSVGGSGTGTWALVASWTWSTNVSNVDFTGLAGANEILVVADSVTLTLTGVPQVQVSTNNGSTFYTTSGDYKAISQSGTSTNGTGISFWSTNATAARTGTVRLIAPNLTGMPRVLMSFPSDSTPLRLFTADNGNDIDAIRIQPSAGLLSGGTIYVLAR